MSDFNGAFLSGVALACAGFMAKEYITFQIKSHRLRRLLSANAGETVSGFKSHLPSLEEIFKNLESDSANFIWEGEGSGSEPAFLADVPIYLSTGESTLALRFYDVRGRIDTIRAEFNTAIRNIIVDPNNRSQYTKIAQSCIHDLQRNYEEACKTGTELCAELRERIRYY
ncbi:MAG TPA: hypothetical protein VIJ53_14350, partial [Acidobacteriaceae bacterium]